MLILSSFSCEISSFSLLIFLWLVVAQFSWVDDDGLEVVGGNYYQIPALDVVDTAPPQS